MAINMTPLGSNPVNFARQVTPAGSSQSANPAEPTVAVFLETPRYDTVDLAKERKLPQFDFENFPEFKSREDLIDNGEPVSSYSSYIVHHSPTHIRYFTIGFPRPDVFDQLAKEYSTAKENIINRSSIYKHHGHRSDEELIKDLNNQLHVAIYDTAKKAAYWSAALLNGDGWYYEGFLASEDRTSFRFDDMRWREYKSTIEKGIYDDVIAYGKLLHEKLTSSSMPAEDFDAAAYLDEQAKGLDTNFSASEFRDFSVAFSALQSGDGKTLASALISLDNTDKTSGNLLLFDRMKNFLNRQVFIDVILSPGRIFTWGDGDDMQQARDYFYSRREQEKEVKEQFLQYMTAHQNADKPNVIMELLARKGEAYYYEGLRVRDERTMRERDERTAKATLMQQLRGRWASGHLLGQTPEGQGTEPLLPNAKAQGKDIAQIIAEFLIESNEENYSSFLDLKEPGIPSDE